MATIGVRVMTASEKRILHIVGGMNRGGVENWLMNVLRHIDRDRFRMDFLVHTDQPRAFDAEIVALGSNVIPCLHPRRPLRYARGFRDALREFGPYDVVHSHVHHFSGYTLWLARRAGVPVRISHSHLDSSWLDRRASPTRRLYLRLMRALIHRCATERLAVSGPSAVALFGETCDRGTRYRLFPCAFELDPFRAQVDPVAVRVELDLPSDSFVVGHVGRFAQQKNHEFLLEVFGSVRQRRPDARLLLVGDGPIRGEIERRAERLGLREFVVFAGDRSDVPRLLIGAVDVFVFPSTHEGLGIAVLEAQAAGLPCVAADTLPGEATVIDALMRRISLAAPVKEWVEAVLSGQRLPRSDALARFTGTPFEIIQSTGSLERLYGEATSSIAR